MKWTEFAMLVGGLALGLFGWLMIAGSLLSLKENVGENLALGILLGIIPAALSIFLVRKSLSTKKRRKQEELERTLLDLAASSGGILVPAQVARHTDLTLAEAKAKLDELHLSGYCGSEVDESGQLVYSFK